MGFTTDGLIVSKRYPRVVKLEMGLHHKSLKVMEFMIELHHESLIEDESSVDASPHRLLHMCELVSNLFHKRVWEHE